MSYRSKLRESAKEYGKMSGIERTPMQRAIYVMNGMICDKEREIELLRDAIEKAIRWDDVTYLLYDVYDSSSR